MSDGLFVVIEGLDASGKRTQARRLVDHLESEGDEARYVEFPTHGSTPIGQVIDRYLQGDYDVAPEVRALLYAADRYQFADEFEAFLDGGGTLVVDRYSQSNYAFQTTEFADEEWTDAVDWMQQVESRLPQPDLVILLDVPPETARDLMVDKEKDVLEQDVAFQEEVLGHYKTLADREGWHVVDCTDDDGAMRSIDSIHADIRDIVDAAR